MNPPWINYMLVAGFKKECLLFNMELKVAREDFKMLFHLNVLVRFTTNYDFDGPIVLWVVAGRLKFTHEMMAATIYVPTARIWMPPFQLF